MGSSWSHGHGQGLQEGVKMALCKEVNSGYAGIWEKEAPWVQAGIRGQWDWKGGMQGAGRMSWGIFPSLWTPDGGQAWPTGVGEAVGLLLALWKASGAVYLQGMSVLGCRHPCLPLPSSLVPKRPVSAGSGSD